MHRSNPTPRSERESLSDGLMVLTLLYLSSLVSSLGNLVGDRLKVTKLIFHATYELFRRKAKGLNLSFYKYTWGPFTRELYETWEDLSSAAFLEIPSGAGLITLTDKGKMVAEKFLHDVLRRQENSVFFEILLDTALRHGRKPTSQLLRECYSKRVQPLGLERELTIADVPEGTHFTERIEEKDAKVVLHVEDEWLQEFDIERRLGFSSDPTIREVISLHSPGVLRSIQEAIEADQRGEGRMMSREELLSEIGVG